MATALKIVSELLNLGCYTDRHSYVQMNIHLFTAFAGVVCLMVLVPLYGVAGAVASLVVANAVRLILFYVISQRHLRLPYRLATLYGAALMSVSLIVIGQANL